MKEHDEGTKVYARIVIEIATTVGESEEGLPWEKLNDEVQNPIVDLLDGLNCPDFTFRVDES